MADAKRKPPVQGVIRSGPYPILGLAEEASADEDAPLRRWVLIAPLGTQVVPGYVEPYTLDEAGAKRIVEVWQHYADHGHRAIFDWGHGSVFPSTPEMHGKSGEIYGMEFRSGEGVYADVEFTPRASKLIRSGDFDQVSPEIRGTWRNLDSGEVEEGPAVHAVALTARGQLGNMPALAASWRALAERFGMTDANAVLEAITRKVDTAAKAGLFGPCDMQGGGYQYDVRATSVDPEWTGVVVRNSKTGQHYAADIVDQDGKLGLANIREGTLEFKPKDKAPPEGGSPEDMIMADAAQAKALTDAQAEVAALKAEVASFKALADAAKAAGAETAEALKALAERPAPDRIVVLEATVKTLGENLQSRDAEIKALSDAKAVLDAERQQRDAAALVRVYEDKGKITPATRDHFRAFALANPDDFKALAEALPVVVNLNPRGTGGDNDRSEQPEDLHGVAMALAETMTPGAPMTSYAKAIEKVSKDRPELVEAWRANVPNVVQLRR